jgi:hypothetical protein
MAEFTFEPPITLKPDIVVSMLGDAAAFVRSYQGSRRPPMQQAILRRLDQGIQRTVARRVHGREDP